MVRISVIIPAHNDRERLKLCLEALSQQTLQADEYEVIVVDNRSDPPLQDIVEQFSFCRYASESKPGSYAARNTGLKEARGEIFAFTDSDCIPAPDWLESGCKTLTELASNGCIGGKIELFAKNPEKPNAVELYELIFGLNQQSNVEKHHFAATANMFTTRHTLETVGPFNTQLKSGGDLEWGRRVHSADRPIVYAANTVIRHPTRSNLKQIRIQARRHAGGHFDLSLQKNRRFFTVHKCYVLWQSICPQFRKMYFSRKKLSELGYGYYAWLRVCGVISTIQYTRLFEYFRRLFGGKPETR